MLPDFWLYIIQKRKNTPNFSFIGNSEEKAAYFLCRECKLIMKKVQKKLNLESSIMKLQRVAAMLCLNAEGHVFETYITVVIKIT